MQPNTLVKVASGASVPARQELETERGTSSGNVEDVTERLVRELAWIWNCNAVGSLTAVGEAIIRSCYGGDVEIWRNRGRNPLLKRLERHKGLPFSRKTIFMALHLHDLSLRDGESLEGLGIGHVRVVFGLPVEEQRELLLAARSERLTIAQLTKRVAERRRGGLRRSGRPPLPPSVKVQRSIAQHVDALKALLADVLLCDLLAAEQIETVRICLDDIAAKLQASAQRTDLGSRT